MQHIHTSGSGSGVEVVIRELQSLRFSFMHASIGLPLPSVRHLMALARLRPSSLPLDSRPPPPTAASSTQGSGSSHAAIISPRVGPLPTWTIQQTRAFGQLFLDRMKKAAAAQRLPLDAYALAAAAAAAPVPAARLEAWHHDAVAAFNGGRSVTEIARACQQQRQAQQQQPATAASGGPVDEATVLRWLAEAEALGLQVAWEQRLGVAPQLLEAVGVAVDVVRALEPGRDPLALDFPLQCLRQLLPDFGDADVLAGLCALRHQQKQLKALSSGHPKQQQAAAVNRAPLAPLPCPPTRQAPPPPAASSSTSTSKLPPPKPEAAAAPPAVAGQPLEAQVMAVLQARASAPEGVSVDECVRALAGKAPRAAVEACLVGLEESFMAYRGPGGGFKLL